MLYFRKYGPNRNIILCITYNDMVSTRKYRLVKLLLTKYYTEMPLVFKPF